MTKRINIHSVPLRTSLWTNMPKIKTTRTKPPPEGYEDIEEVHEHCS